MTSLMYEQIKAKTQKAKHWAALHIVAMTIAWLGVAIVSARTSSAQILGVPFAGTTVAAGSATTVGAYCSGTTGPTALDIYGDGCPAAQAVVTASKLQNLWTDTYGNIYIADWTNTHLLRVIYRGGAPLAAIISANNPTLSGAPQVGYIYAIAGNTNTVAALSTTTTTPYCNGSSGTKAVDTTGNGCPAYEAWTAPTGGDTDADGDIFLADHTSSVMLKVIYAGGAAAAKLIKLETGITSPVIGSIYRIGDSNTGSSGYDGDGGLAGAAHFRNSHSLVVDSNENIYVADTANNVVRVINGATGIVKALAGGAASGCVTGTATASICPATYTGDNGPATSATLSGPYEVALDSNGNIYIADTGNGRVRMVYVAGTPPLLTAAGISNPVAGYIYTVVGGTSAGVVGTSTTPGASATSLKITAPTGVSFDSLWNLYVVDNSASKIWRIDGQTGVATLFAGGGAATTVGAYCSGTTGQKATSTVGDGCPATQSYLHAPTGRLVFDANNVAYIADYSNGRVRSFTFNERFSDTVVGVSSSFPLAVTSAASFAAPTLAVTTQGVSATEFSAANANCVSGTQTANTVCTYNITFKPALPGPRVGNVQVSSTSSTAKLVYGLDGKGLAPLLAVAPNAQSTFGSSITVPGNVVVDQQGNIYVSDTAQSKLWKGTAGGTFSAVLSGLSSPGQTAVDGAGNVYIADTGNNRIVELSVAGVTSTLAISGLSSPGGIVSTGNGILYIADTGNNRILRYNQAKVTALALTGLNAPSSLALDGDGLLYIADTGNNRLLAINSDGTQSTVSVGATVTPAALAVDAADNLYVADRASESVLMVPYGSSSVNTKASGLSSPAGVAVDGSGNLYYTDSAVAGISQISQKSASLTFANTNFGDMSAPQQLTLNNIGNQSISFTSPATYAGSGDTADFAISQGTPACGSGPVVAAGLCVLSAQFTPISTGAYQEIVSFPSNAANASSVSAKLSGTGVNLIRTSLAAVLTSPASGSVSYGQSAVYTATLTTATTTSTPTGNIVVSVDGAAVQTLPVSGKTTQFTLVFSAGVHAITVTYSGDSNYTSSYSTLTLNVSTQATVTTLSYTTSLQSTATLTLTAQVTPTISGTPTGTITFYSGTTVLGTGVLNSQDVANYTTTTTTYPSYSFRAVYSGDTNYATSSSATNTLTPDYSVIQAATVIKAAIGYPVVTTVTLTPYFGYSGTLTYSCTGLPAAAGCRFQPQSISLGSGTPQTLTLQLFTNLSPTLTSLRREDRVELVSFACLLGPLMLMGGCSQRFRRKYGKFRMMLLLLAGLAGMGSLVGCGHADAYSDGSTPAGTSTVILTVKDTAGLTHAVSYQFTVY